MFAKFCRSNGLRPACSCSMSRNSRSYRTQTMLLGRIETGWHLLAGCAMNVLLLVALLLALAGPTYAFTNGFPPGLTCSLDVRGNEIVVNGRLTPQDAASIQAGSSVTFSAESASPLTFALASSPSLLPTPDIGIGAGVVQPSATAMSTPTYTFTSSAAASVPRTIYWTASFLESGIPSCASLSPAPSNSVTSPVHTLTVLPAPVIQEPAPAPLPEPLPAPLHIGIRAQGKVHLSRGTVSYPIYCASICTGETSYQVFAARRHRRAIHIPSLDLGDTSVSSNNPGGGTQHVTRRYNGRSLRGFKALLREHDTVTLHIMFKATGPAGIGVEARDTVRVEA